MALLQRLHDFLSGPGSDPAIAALYRACVAQARRVEFYQNLSVPDTLDGRFDLLLLHVFLVMQRLGDQKRAKQQLFDLMFSDMDRSLREMGVGDMSIAKKIKPMISAFYGRGQVYEKALNNRSDLEQALMRNLYGKTPPGSDKISRIAAYVGRCVTALQMQPLQQILAGAIHFPEPLSGHVS